MTSRASIPFSSGSPLASRRFAIANECLRSSDGAALAAVLALPGVDWSGARLLVAAAEARCEAPLFEICVAATKAFASEALFASCLSGSPDPSVLRLLLAAGANPDWKPAACHVPGIHFLARAGRVEAIRELLDAGAAPNSHPKGEPWQTPLACCVAGGSGSERLEACRALLAAGARAPDLEKLGEPGRAFWVRVEAAWLAEGLAGAVAGPLKTI